MKNESGWWDLFGVCGDAALRRSRSDRLERGEWPAGLMNVRFEMSPAAA